MTHYFTTLVSAGVGVVVFHSLGLPLPWLFGPLFACLIIALFGVPLKSYKPLNDAMRTILGVAVGATVTWSFLNSAVDLWPTLILIPLMVLAIGAVGIPYFHRLWGFDWQTSYYSAMPGGLQDMLVFGEEAGGNVRTMSLIHATRVLVIVVALPMLMQNIWGANLDRPPGAPAIETPIPEMLVMLVCALVGWQLAKRVGMFGASILGPMLLTAVASLAGLIHTRPPAEAIWAAQFFIGITVGSKYVGITVSEIRRDVLAGLGFCGILIALTLVFFGIIEWLSLAPPMEALLSFAPGGQAELVVLAIIVGADVTFVVAHHLLRIWIVIMGAPIAARIFRKS